MPIFFIKKTAVISETITRRRKSSRYLNLPILSAGKSDVIAIIIIKAATGKTVITAGTGYNPEIEGLILTAVISINSITAINNSKIYKTSVIVLFFLMECDIIKYIDTDIKIT